MKVIHGGNREKVAAKIGISPTKMIDFSANINPLGLSPTLRQSLIQALDQVSYYPNPDYPNLRAAIATHFKVQPDDVEVGNGAVQLIFNTANAVNATHALVLAPTFGEYERAFKRSGMVVDHYTLTATNQFQVDVDDLIQNLQAQPAIDLLCICNPNNPTGQVIKANEMTRVVRYCQAHQIWLIIDEAFMDFVERDAESFMPQLTSEMPVIILRSATKFFAIPGLRLGFAVTKNATLKQAWQMQAEPWSVNTLAQAFGEKMYADQAYIDQTYQWLETEGPFLKQQLAALPQLTTFPSATNYCLFQCQLPQLREKLWPLGIMIRSCADYVGLDDTYYRVAVRSREENVKLIRALKKCVRPSG